ncbi:hypothetical protein PR048_008997 [Dryococelus australis]|uniref:Uncharacterized protein n=1 Tax=Dryococelus australis TaxID=614101 RepID=A0ABQ9HYP0_9NEOP|nr:hypothetical protein PR048_008997 [Dryococelus australis]
MLNDLFFGVPRRIQACRRDPYPFLVNIVTCHAAVLPYDNAPTRHYDTSAAKRRAWKLVATPAFCGDTSFISPWISSLLLDGAENQIAYPRVFRHCHALASWSVEFHRVKQQSGFRHLGEENRRASGCRWCGIRASYATKKLYNTWQHFVLGLSVCGLAPRRTLNVQTSVPLVAYRHNVPLTATLNTHVIHIRHLSGSACLGRLSPIAYRPVYGLVWHSSLYFPPRRTTVVFRNKFGNWTRPIFRGMFHTGFRTWPITPQFQSVGRSRGYYLKQVHEEIEKDASILIMHPRGHLWGFVAIPLATIPCVEHPAIQFVPKLFYKVEVGALGGPVQSANIVVGVPLHITEYVICRECARHCGLDQLPLKRSCDLECQATTTVRSSPVFTTADTSLRVAHGASWHMDMHENDISINIRLKEHALYKLYAARLLRDIKTNARLFEFYLENQLHNGMCPWLEPSSTTKVNQVRFPAEVAPGVVPVDAAGRRVSSGTSRFPSPCIPGYYAVVRRQQCSLIGLACPGPRPQPCRTSLGRIGSPGEGSSGTAKIHCSTHGMVARGIATNPHRCPANIRKEHTRVAAVIAARGGPTRFKLGDNHRQTLWTGIVPDDAVGRRVFSGISCFPPSFYSGTAPYSPQSHSSAVKTSMLRVIQISSLFTH